MSIAAGVARRDDPRLEPQATARRLRLLHHLRLEDRVGRVPENRHAPSLGNDLGEDLEGFSQNLDRDGRVAGDVPARTGETGNEASSDRVPDSNHDDGNGARGLPAASDACVTNATITAGFEFDQLSREVGEALESSLRPPVLDGDVLPLDVTALTQPVPQALRLRQILGPGSPEDPYLRDLPRLQRRGGERRGEETASDDRREGASRLLST